jgi:hypothetical protein
MRWRQSTLLISVLPLLTNPALGAQKKPVEIGARVRVTTSRVVPELPVDTEADQECSSGRSWNEGSQKWVSQILCRLRLVGNLAARDRDSLTVDQAGVPTTLTLAHVSKFEVSSGKKSNSGRGALKGGLAGATLGLVIGISAWAGSEPGDYFTFGPEAVAASAGVLGAIGAGVGLLIGGLTRSERWEEVPLEELRVGPSPIDADGVEISVTLPL